MDLREALSLMAGRVVQGMRPDDPVTLHYAGLMRQFGEHALRQWSAVSASGLRCSIRRVVAGAQRIPCAHPAAGPCLGCGNMVCCGHGMVSAVNGSILCVVCVQKHPSVQSAPPPPEAGPRPGAAPASDDEAARLEHLQVLGLEPGATLAQIKERFRSLSKSAHPDKVRADTPAGRQAAEQRYRRMTEAFHWLIEHAAEEAA